MAKYKQTPVEVDARQYTGGERNGQTLASWVNSLGGFAVWSNSNTYQDLTLPEELYLGKSKIHMEWSVPVGFWLVNEEGFITIYSDEVFKTKFEKA